MIRTLHFWIVFALLAGAFVFIRWRGDTDLFPPSQALERFPVQIGPWMGTDLPIQAAVRDILGKGDFLSRSYAIAAPGQDTQSGQVDGAPVGLFIGYFPTQRSGQSIHSPQNCLPGAGWSFDSQGVTTLQGAHGKALRVGEYLISNGKSRDEVLYWYRSHGRTIASDYQAKWFTLLDSIRYRRTDAALIRVITPLKAGESPQQAHERVTSFAERLDVILPAYIPD